MKGLSALCLLGVFDAGMGLIHHQNMYTLQHWRTGGIIANVVTLVLCLVLGPFLWRLAQARAWQQALALRGQYEAGEISELERDYETRQILRDFD